MMEFTTLGRTGFRVSTMGLGGAPLGGDFGSITEAEVERIVHTAVDVGINFIDTAPLYGRGESERRIGRALKAGKRDQVIVATKAVMRGVPYTYEETIRSVEDSLARLQMDHVDLIQIHETEAAGYDRAIHEVLPAFMKLKEQGKVRAFGVNARDLTLLTQCMETNAFDTIQFHSRYMLIDHTARDHAIPLARKLNIGIINGSVLGMGLLAEAPPAFMQKDPAILEEAKHRISQLEFLREHENVGGLIPAAMRFSLASDEIDVTLSGIRNVDELIQNTAYCDRIDLAASDRERVYALFRGKALF